MRGAVSFKKNAFLKSDDAARVFLDNGEVPAIGYVIKQPDLADSLELLASKGADGYYKGAFAKKLVAGVRQLGGNWTEADLANYKVVERRAGGRPLSRRAHRVGLAADLGRHRADRRAEHPRRLRPRQGRHRDAHASHRRGHASRASRSRRVSRRSRFRRRPGRAAHQRATTRTGSALPSAWIKATPSASLPGVDAAPAGTQTTHFLRARRATATWSRRPSRSISFSARA